MNESDELSKLADLHQRGALSDEEFARAKARILTGAVGAGAYQGSGGEALHALRRSRDDRWLGGVCGGVARVTGSPSWVWRLLFAFLFICAGTGALLYILLWIFVPEEPARSFDVPAGNRAA
jgi:phage shock protein PspC (stress-responsive transcriptional regulator)